MIRNRWLPLALMALLVSASFLLRRSLVHKDQEALRRLDKSQLEAVSLRVTGRVQTKTDPLIRIAERLNQLKSRGQRDQWRFDAALAFEPAVYDAIAWVDPNLHVVDVVPKPKFSNVCADNPENKARLRTAMEAARRNKSPRISAPIRLPDGEQTFRVLIPIFKGDQFAGTVSGVFSADKFFDMILRDVSPGFGVAILDGNESLYRRFGESKRAASPWLLDRSVTLYGRTWHVQVWPTPAELAKSDLSYPDLTLAIGILMSFLLAGAVDFAQHSRRRTSELEEASLRLQQEIAQRRRTEDTVRRLAAIVESSADAIVGSGLDDVIQTWNQGAVQVFGYTEREVIGRHVSMLVPPERREELATIRETIRRGESIGPFETRRMRKDGRPIDISLRVSPVRDENGNIVGKAVIGRDTTELKQMERQFWLAQRMEAIGRLAAGIAHDFNNLLGIMLGYADLAAERAESPDTVRTMAAEINKAGERAGTLVRQLLAFSRQQQMEPRVLDLNQLVSNMTSMLERVVGAGIDLGMDLDPSLGAVKADPTQVEQIVLNLVINARDAMPSGGRLAIQTCNAELDDAYAQRHSPAKPGRYVMMSVTDTGNGMDSVTREHIFEPFFTTKQAKKGTGLGLATVYGIVKQTGGYIWVYSEIGHGTAFKIYLPRTDELKDSPEDEERDADRYEGKETILVVEDEDSLRKVTLEYLRSSGYTVLEALGAEHAMTIAREYQQPIELLLTDVIMPGMNGMQLSDEIRRVRPDIKVLYVSGYASEMVWEWDAKAAEDKPAFLAKPFNRRSLTRKVREVLENTGAQKEVKS